MQSGYYDDDGTPINLDKIKVPDLCKQCSKNEIPENEVLCNLNRFDQSKDIENGKKFICGSFDPK